MAPRDWEFGNVTVVLGEGNGRYPHGNSVWVRGRDCSALIDPSLTVVSRAEEFRERVDLILQSHVHEDHIAGVHLFPSAEVYAHHEDALGLRSVDGFVSIYGQEAVTPDVRDFLVSAFHYVERPDVRSYENGAIFDVGGATIQAIHTPGHTRGHCAFLIEPEGVLFLGDIDLTRFGPYYGDAWSDLPDFERSLQLVRSIEARVWVSFHQAGIIRDRRTFLDRLERFAARIVEREEAMLAFLAQPRTMEELVAHRFVYPSHAKLPWIEACERRSIEQHIERLLRTGRIRADSDGRYQSAHGR